MKSAAVQLDMLDGRRKRRNARYVALESQEQEALFDWAGIAQKKYPELWLLHHIPNGGFRPKTTAAALKRQGVKPGIPDICLPVARNGHNSLYIELKRVGNGDGTTEAQDAVIAALRASGSHVCVCAGWESAKTAIESYLDGRKWP